MNRWGADAVVLSGHKMGALKGVGALVMNKGLPCRAQITGGPQEDRLRAGTLNVPAVVGLGAACELAGKDELWDVVAMEKTRSFFEKTVLDRFPFSKVNGHKTLRLPHIANVCFQGKDAETLFWKLDAKGICVSTGSACSSGIIDASHVLRAMGQSVTEARSALRFSFGDDHTEEHIQEVVSVLSDCLETM